MASLNLSTNGPSIKSSYNGVVSGPPLSSSSPTYAQWALFSVQAPLVSAFQDGGAKESVLKVEGTGDGELADLIEDFNEGRIQYAFVKVKDPNTALPKCVLIAWCGGGVPERTKGYFTSHTAAVAKVLHGYHVQITARSDSDLEPESIMKKVSDASGAKYSAAGAGGVSGSAPPPVRSKPVFTPTASSSGRSVNPIVAARSRRDENVDSDGWGADAPPVTRTEIEKVEPAYRPTKVNMAELTKQKPASSDADGLGRRDDSSEDVVKGGYQPVGKVDIAAIRAAAKRQEDDRPVPVKGAYEPVGKVDIAAIRAKAQKPGDAPTEDTSSPTRQVADRTGQSAERITSMPKPRVSNKFGGGSSFTGTKAPAPGGLGFGSSSPSSPAPVTTTSRTFADQGGKTPAQIWAEKKARERGGSDAGGAMASPLGTQSTGAGEWKSGYTGKTWAPVHAPGYSRGAADSDGQQNPGDTDGGAEEEPVRSPGGISAIRDRFKDAPPMRSPAAHENESTSPVHDGSRPSKGFALPGLPNRLPPPADEEEEQAEEEPSSPIRVAAPVARGAVENKAAAPQEEEHEPTHAGAQRGKRALIQYDYEKAEDNEIDLVDGEYVTNIDMVDEDWWMGTNSAGESGLFPSNYVELVDDDEGEAAPAPAPAAPAPPPAPPVSEPALEAGGATATAMYDYEAAEDNELSFPEDAKITNLEFPDEDWWFGHYNGQSGLFPANYVELDS
ncbi:hypothetical protein CP533_4441 [Ophiocordyceps camponoti-saundersi (nom. inval.)]|nr:hypothetical protein CP533_4441 [Ophiocordyceps camponoti-saundersi (nom. inval.)]